MDKVVVDPVDTLEQHAQKQHGKDWRRDVQGFEKDCQHAGRALRDVVRGLMISPFPLDRSHSLRGNIRQMMPEYLRASREKNSPMPPTANSAEAA
ncbi:hypothetical protein D3C71_1790470 [compost metagenome]